MPNIVLSKSLALTPEIAGRRTAVFGISGSGKSNTAAVMAEQLLKAGEQVVLIDPKGEGWGLLSLANGKPSPFPVIVFGEPHGHIETLSENHGERLADFVAESGRSVVLSLLGFESDQSERRFVSTFLRRLYRLKSRQAKSTRTLVILDEAHLFVPENVRGDAAELAGAVQRIVRQGRSFGLGTLLVDQRPQDVSKRCVTQCDTLICHQLIHKTDRDALRDWVRGFDTDGRGEEFLASLATLQPGEAWVWSPAAQIFQRMRINRRTTFDSGAAPDGTASAAVMQRATVDLESLRGQLQEIVDKARADDPQELRQRIAQLQKQLAEKPELAVDRSTIDAAVRAERTRLLNLFCAKFGYADSELIAIARRVDGLRERLDKAWQTISGMKVSGSSAGDFPSPMNQTAHLMNQTAPPAGKKPHKVNQRPTALAELNRTQQRILAAIAWYESIGNHEPSALQVGVVALIDHTGGHFSNVVGPLSSGGYLHRGNGTLRLTDAGRSLAQPIESVTTLADYHAMLRERVLRMKTASRRTVDILDVLIRYQGKSVSSVTIGTETGIDHTGGHFSNTIGPLSTAGLIERRQGIVTPTEILFPKDLI